MKREPYLRWHPTPHESLNRYTMEVLHEAALRENMSHEDIIGKHAHLFAKPENYTPPTNKEEDCICGGFKSGGKSRALIANCPCCDGIQTLVVDVCDCPDPSFIKFKVVLPPDSTMRIRYIKTVEPIS